MNEDRLKFETVQVQDARSNTPVDVFPPVHVVEHTLQPLCEKVEDASQFATPTLAVKQSQIGGMSELTNVCNSSALLEHLADHRSNANHCISRSEALSD